MKKIWFNICALVSTIKYYIQICFYFEGKFKRLPYRIYNLNKIYTWQKRELNIYMTYKHNHTFVYGSLEKQLSELQKIRSWVINNIAYKKDIVNHEKKEYWATTYEILRRGTGDCEDQAFVMYRKMIEAGFPRNKIGIVCVKGHAFACYHYCSDDFYILDNGYISNKIVKATELFICNKCGKNTELRPIIGFNTVNLWAYK